MHVVVTFSLTTWYSHIKPVVSPGSLDTLQTAEIASQTEPESPRAIVRSPPRSLSPAVAMCNYETRAYPACRHCILSTLKKCPTWRWRNASIRRLIPDERVHFLWPYDCRPQEDRNMQTYELTGFCDECRTPASQLSCGS